MGGSFRGCYDNFTTITGVSKLFRSVERPAQDDCHQGPRRGVEPSRSRDELVHPGDDLSRAWSLGDVFEYLHGVDVHALQPVDDVGDKPAAGGAGQRTQLTAMQ